MSAKDVFEKKSKKVLKLSSMDTVGDQAESKRYVEAKIKDKKRFLPQIDFEAPENFAKFGSAEKYYIDSIERVYKSYPYDGSLYEKTAWLNSSSYLDVHLFENKYPRTNGYALFSPAGWGTFSGYKSQNIHNISSSYGIPATKEYILLRGGPNKDTNNTDKRDFFPSIESNITGSKGANVFDLTKNRESNLKIGGIDGNTIEFWLKKDAWTYNGVDKGCQNEVIFDLYNVSTPTNMPSSSHANTRFRVELDGAPSVHSPIRVTYMSGTNGCFSVPIGHGSGSVSGSSYVTKASIADGNWHHYAIVVENSGSSLLDPRKTAALSAESKPVEQQENFQALKIKLYIDGQHNNTVFTGSSVDYCSASLHATIGALAQAPSSSTQTYDNQAMLGAGKLSASLDEFRFWKKSRNAREIGLNWNGQVGGGTNIDDANTDLGVYYKFNEGITQTSSVDQNVLDYSGRLTNGYWEGYSTNSRSTESAIVQAGAATKEFKDPIVYSFHPDVQDLKNDKKKVGINHDTSNSGLIFSSLPEWIQSDDSKNSGELRNLTQIIASYFDTLALQIKELPRLKDVTYPSASYKPHPFVEHMLDSSGFTTSEIFADAEIVEKFLSKDENVVYEDDLHNIKNRIYQNIYNNLDYIYKSKGTEKGFRNLIRCFGVDDEVLKVNIYANNATYAIEDNTYETVEKTKCADFFHSASHEAVVYQMTGSESNEQVRSYISGTINALDTANKANQAGMGMTYESEIIFPKTTSGGTSQKSNIFNETTSSLFGMHTPKIQDEGVTTDEQQFQTTFAATDTANFQVFFARERAQSAHGRFILTSSAGTLQSLVNPSLNGHGLTSSLFHNVYGDRKWNFAVRIRPRTSGSAALDEQAWGNVVSGAYNNIHGTETLPYQLDFYGVSMVSGRKADTFHLSASISKADGDAFLMNPKRMFVGAHRTNFTGTVLQSTDVKVSSLRVWLDHLSNEEIDSHARDAGNYGRIHPYQNAYLFENSGSRPIPQTATRILNWDFKNVTGSDAAGSFYVQDISSGSAASNHIDLDEGDYGWANNLVNTHHPGVGYGFPTSNTKAVDVVYISSARQQLPEINNSTDMVSVLAEDDKRFMQDSRPSAFYFAIEKSPYQTVSKEMLKLFATVKDFNNLIGEPVNKYRQSYKRMEKLRAYFFKKLRNTIDVEKYVQFYRWIDSSVSDMILQLFPASATHSKEIRTVIESHILERNKYQHKYPHVGQKYGTEGDELVESNISAQYNNLSAQLNNMLISDTTTAQIAPVNEDGTFNEDENQGFWQNYEDGFVDLDEDINTARKDLNRSLKKGYGNEHNFSGDFGDAGQEGLVVINQGNNADTPAAVGLVTGGDENADKENHIELVAGSIGVLEEAAKKVKEATPLTKLKKHPDALLKGATDKTNQADSKLYFASIGSVYEDIDGFKFTNIHHDAWTVSSRLEGSLQSPFTAKHVGGQVHRRTALNTGSYDNLTEARSGAVTGDFHGTYGRPEAFRITAEASDLDRTVSPSAPNIKIYAPDRGLDGTKDLQLQKSTFHRGPRRPVSTKNILIMTGSEDGKTVEQRLYNASPVGNYQKNYQVIQLSGRRNNSTWFAQNAQAQKFDNQNTEASLQFSPEVPVLHISGSTESMAELYKVDFELLERTPNKSVFVERFSAPGGFEVMSRGYLDRRGEEISAYNSLNYRNLFGRYSSGSMRGDDSSPTNTFSNRTRFSGTVSIEGGTKHDGLYALLYRRAGKFGQDSVYGSMPDDGKRVGLLGTPATASYHKTHANVGRRISFVTTSSYHTHRGAGARASNFHTSSHYDNFFVTHAIPRSDLQYSWITASAVTDVAGLNGAASTRTRVKQGSDFLGLSPTVAGYEGKLSSSIGFQPPITFLSQSELFTAAQHQTNREIAAWINPNGGDHAEGEDVPQDIQAQPFVPLNYALYEPVTASVANVDVTSSLNTLGFARQYNPEQWVTTARTDYRHPLKSATTGQTREAGTNYLNQNIIFAALGSHTTGHTSQKANAMTLNPLLLRRNGPYQHPTWKQIRTGEHPVARQLRRDNQLSILHQIPVQRESDLHQSDASSTSRVVSNYRNPFAIMRTSPSPPPGTKFDVSAPIGPITLGIGGLSAEKQSEREYATQLYKNEIRNYLMSPLTSKYSPIVQTVADDEGNEITLKHAYGNNIEYMPLDKLDAVLNTKENTPQQLHDTLVDQIVDDESLEFKELVYKETVFPREQNQYLARTRGRVDYSSLSRHDLRNTRHGQQRTFWRNSMEDRILTRVEQPLTGSDHNTSGSGDSCLNSMGFQQFHNVGTSSARSKADGSVNYQDPPPVFSSAWYNIIPANSIWPLDGYQVSGSRHISKRIRNFNTDGFPSQMHPTGSIVNGELMNPTGYTSMMASLAGLNPVPHNPPERDETRVGGLQDVPHWYAPCTASQIFVYPQNCPMFGYGNRTTPDGMEPLDGAQAQSVALNRHGHYFYTHDFWKTAKLSGKNPWFDSYSDYAEDVRPMAQGYSVVPEFRISEHMDHYVSNKFSFNNRFLTLEGASIESGSADTPTDAYNQDFFEVYSHSDFMKHFGQIRDDYKDVADPTEMTLRCSGIKKLLPYQGFYPVLRCTQLGTLFSSSYAPFISGSNTSHVTASVVTDAYKTVAGNPNIWSKLHSASAPVSSDAAIRTMALLQPFYAPGIMYNTIKAGCAVDYPIVTGSVPSTAVAGTYEFFNFLSGGTIANSKKNPELFNFRMPFEAIIEPHTYIPVSSSVTDGDTNLGKNRISFINLFSASSEIHNLYCDWKGEYDNKYSMAANNFFGEVPRFFLKEGSLRTFTSKPENQFKPMKSGSVYYMDVDMYMTPDMVQSEGPSHLQMNSHLELGTKINYFSASQGYNRLEKTSGVHVDYRGGLYGPPCQWSLTSSDAQSSDRYRQVADPAFAPFTPPYFYGRSTARIAFSPHEAVALLEDESHTFTLDDILAQARIETIYTGSNPSLHSSSHIAGENYIKTPAVLSQMRVSSSLSLFGKTRGKEIEYNVEQLAGKGKFKAMAAKDTSDSGLDRWVISTKFECPILNFSGNMKGLEKVYDESSAEYAEFGAAPEGLAPRRLTVGDTFMMYLPNKPTNHETHTWPASTGSNGTLGLTVTEFDKSVGFMTGSVILAMSQSIPTRGMWSGYGSVPSGSTGIFLRLRESFPEETYGSKASVGASGSLIDVCGFEAGNQRMGELASDGEKVISEAIVAIPFIMNNGKRDFFPVRREHIDLLTGKREGLSPKTPEPGSSIIQMVDAMQKFVMPPHLDFLKNQKIEPFVTYIFEFNHALKQDELRDIWQNVMPEIALKAEKQDVSFSHSLGEGEFFDGKDIPAETQWMVFKIKQRAEMSYYAVTADSTDDNRFAFQFKAGGEKKVPEYSYNWPYDYFSLVELAKIDTEVTFKPKAEPIVKTGMKKTEPTSTPATERPSTAPSPPTTPPVLGGPNMGTINNNDGGQY